MQDNAPQSPAPQAPQPPEPPQLQSQEIVGDGTEVIAPEHSFTWQASEFVHHDKPALWYLALFVMAIVLIAALVFLKQWFGIAVIVVMTVAIAVYSRKQPRTLTYAIDDHGISIEGKLSPYNLFHSYSVIPEIAWQEIDLEPARRFAPRLTLLADASNFDQIEEILAHHLPRQDRELDLIERATRYLKF